MTFSEILLKEILQINVSNLQLLNRKRSQEYDDNRNTVLIEITNQGQ
jgi:hypothetical protein